MTKVRMVAVLFFLFDTSTSVLAQDCSEWAGDWSQNESEVHEQPTVINIATSCKTTLLKTAPSHESDNLVLDYLFFENGQLRIQYGIKPGSAVDDDGNPVPIPDPLPDWLKAELQGNVYQYPEGTLSFQIDAIEKWCKENGGECPSAKFYKLTHFRVLE